MTHVLIDDRLFADDAWLRAPHIEALRDGLRLELGANIWVCESWLYERCARLRGGMIAGLGSSGSSRPLGKAAEAHITRQKKAALDALRTRLDAKLAALPDAERMLALGEKEFCVLDDTGAWGVACALASKGRRTLLLTDDPARYAEFARRFADRPWPMPEVVGPLLPFMRRELYRLPQLSNAFILEAADAEAVARAVGEALHGEGQKAVGRLLTRHDAFDLSGLHVGEPEVGFVDIDEREDGSVVVAAILVTEIGVELVKAEAMAEAGGCFIAFDSGSTRWGVIEASVHMELRLRGDTMQVQRMSGVSFDVVG